MRILVICQYYYPEPFRINDICEELASRGHEVTVVTGVPNYPEGEIYPGYKDHGRENETIYGVKIHRCPIIPRKTGAFFRLLNYYSYPYQAKKYLKYLAARGDQGFDVVFVYQLSPVMMAQPAIAYKQDYGTPIVMYCLDLWPESLVAGGVSRTSPAYKLFHNISKRIYQSMDRILVSSRSFSDYLTNEFGVTESEYLPQYAENLYAALEYHEPKETVNLLFAGNVGAAQSVDTIVSAAARLENQNVQFHIVGGGSELERLRVMSGVNVSFYGRYPVQEMPRFYNMADAMLVTLKADPVLSTTLPGKVQSYMAAGKPIIGAADGEVATTIEAAQCGYCGPAEDVDALVENIKQFLASPHKQQLAINARRYYTDHFTRSRFMDKLEETLRNESPGI